MDLLQYLTQQSDITSYYAVPMDLLQYLFNSSDNNKLPLTYVYPDSYLNFSTRVGQSILGHGYRHSGLHFGPQTFCCRVHHLDTISQVQVT